MRKVVVNSTPLIILGNIDCLKILQEMYGEIIIPRAVFEEVKSKEDNAKLNLSQNLSWIKVLEVQDKSNRKMYQAKLHDGEVEVMMLANELSADLLIIDDNAAKKTAKFLGFTVTGTLGVILKAKSEGIIPQVKPIVDEMLRQGFYISPSIIETVLRMANEINLSEENR